MITLDELRIIRGQTEKIKMMPSLFRRMNSLELKKLQQSKLKNQIIQEKYLLEEQK